jgi:hypothetical protein
VTSPAPSWQGRVIIDSPVPRLLRARHAVVRYPGRDNDGVNAVTLTLPDLDGTTRTHPY